MHRLVPGLVIVEALEEVAGVVAGSRLVPRCFGLLCFEKLADDGVCKGSPSGPLQGVVCGCYSAGVMSM